MSSPIAMHGLAEWPPGVCEIDHAGYACLQLSNDFGQAIVSWHGAQLLSWVPLGQRDVLWLSSEAQAAPAAIRGGVPVCWPWFSKQGMPEGAMQHGPVRHVTWKLTACLRQDNGNLQISLEPDRNALGGDAVTAYAHQLEVRLDIELGATLRMQLQTLNRGTTPFALTQALHSYFAVGDVEHIQLDGLEGLRFDSRVENTRDNVQAGAFKLHARCDNTYAYATPSDSHHYQLTDPVWQRQIGISTQGSQSLVVWNPGAVGAAAMADVPDAGWKNFLCVEAANAGADVVLLAPGARHQLQQTLRCQAWSAQ